MTLIEVPMTQEICDKIGSYLAPNEFDLRSDRVYDSSKVSQERVPPLWDLSMGPQSWCPRILVVSCYVLDICLLCT